MNCKAPVEFIAVLFNWYSRCTYCVRMGMVWFQEFRSICVVRRASNWGFITHIICSVN